MLEVAALFISGAGVLIGLLAYACIEYLVYIDNNEILPPYTDNTDQSESYKRLFDQISPLWPVQNYEVLDVYFRADSGFTQGLFYDSRYKLLVESQGLYGVSKVQNLQINHVNREISYSRSTFQLLEVVFGEGACLLNEEEIIVLTWRSFMMYILDRETLKMKKQAWLWAGPQEGWGIASVPPHISEDKFAEDPDAYTLYMTDGTSSVYVVNANTLKVARVFEVVDQEGKLVNNLNELEWIGRYLFANRWQSNTIYKIDAGTGFVQETFDMTVLEETEKEFRKKHNSDLEMDVLNGIAWDTEKEVVYVTGKNWHLVFQIKFG